MKTMSESRKVKRWFTVFVYATAMAWVESAVVFYLRTMIDRLEPYQPHPLPIIGGLGPAELVREAATMVMLLAVGILAGKTWRSRLGYAAMAFGVWDIFYYVFLKVMCGWPHSLTDWDILFLIPLPWWGPVWAPVAISVLLIVWGTIVSAWEGKGLNGLTDLEELTKEGGEERRKQASFSGLFQRDETMGLLTSSPAVFSWGLNFLGVVLALYVFMADSLRVADQGVVALRNVLPVSFNWPMFLLALLLMSAPIIRALRELRLVLNGSADVAVMP
jgi:hypothetical protein